MKTIYIVKEPTIRSNQDESGYIHNKVKSHHKTKKGAKKKIKKLLSNIVECELYTEEAIRKNKVTFKLSDDVLRTVKIYFIKKIKLKK